MHRPDKCRAFNGRVQSVAIHWSEKRTLRGKDKGPAFGGQSDPGVIARTFLEPKYLGFMWDLSLQ